MPRSHPRILRLSCFVTLLFFLSGIAAMDPEPAPVLIAPPDDARFGDENTIVVLEWENTGADRYELELAVDNEFEIGTGPMDMDDATFFNLTDFIGDEDWFPLNLSLYWRVRSVSEGTGPGIWSEVRIFHKSTLPVLNAVAGADGRYSDTTDMPLLAWESPDSSEAFDFAVSMDPEFESTLGCVRVSTPQLDFSSVNRTTWDALEGVFYWRVCAVTGDDVPGPWSDICRLSKTRIDAPAVIAPADGQVFPPTSSPAILSWESLGTSNQYQIRLYADPAGEIDLVTLDHSGSTTYNFKTDLGIDDETWFYAPFTLYWAVAGFDSNNRPGPFSTPREMIKPGYHRVAGYGDSITAGECLDNGYLNLLDAMLVPVWGEKTSTVNIAVPGMKSDWGAEHMQNRLKGSCPQFVLIMFGTNDSVDPGNCVPPFECDVAAHLAEMGTIARNRGSIPIIGTIIPVNPEGSLAGAQDDVDANNEDIIQMAEQMNFDLVDLNALFWSHGNLPELFCDWGHPNEEGYGIMATGFFNGIMDAVN
ncbi:MAG TPA: SGNH/GDSL hydrolase family protein [bacterium]|nr:SGNH/GDSL hydrolase family protein [bacterium]